MNLKRNWRTTVVAFIGALAVLGANFGLDVGADVQVMIVTAVMFVIGLMTKDAAVTGTDEKPR